jgi:hypothetical protein
MLVCYRKKADLGFIHLVRIVAYHSEKYLIFQLRDVVCRLKRKRLNGFILTGL